MGAGLQSWRYKGLHLRRYNAGVVLHRYILLLLVAALIACNRAPANEQAVRAGIIEHLSKNTGLDLQAMSVDVKNVNFQGSQATATVSFRPKSSPDAGMSMNYILERRGEKWVVSKSASSGHGPGTPPPMQSPATPGSLPPGHPPVGESPSTGRGNTGTNALPPGHPPVGSQPQQPKK
jgi:hypothetical protein